MQRTFKNLAMVAGVTASVIAFNGCAQLGKDKSSATSMDDKSINQRAEKALENDPTYKYPAVKVTTFRGSTQLSGFVETDEQKRRATDIVRTIMGPSEVINNIVVRPSALTPPVRDAATTTTTGSTTSSGATGTGTTTQSGTSGTSTTVDPTVK
jgi:hyperosmotically inducible periplasmic protein